MGAPAKELMPHHYQNLGCGTDPETGLGYFLQAYITSILIPIEVEFSRIVN